MEYIKDILPENNWNIVQSPGNGHYLVYSTIKSWNSHFISTHKSTQLVIINSSFLYYCTFYSPLWLVIVYTTLIEIYNPRYVVYKPRYYVTVK